MGITTEEFFENVYRVIFSPKSFFEQKDIKISLRLAVGLIAAIASINKITSGILEGTIKDGFFIIFLIGSIIGSLFLWFLTGLFFEYIAKIFDRGGDLAKILVYTAFAPIPFIFFAPLNLIKNIGDWGYLLSVNLEVILYLWVIILYAFSLRAAYKISLSRSFMMIFLPFISSFFAVYWIIGFCTKLWYIFSI